MSNEAADNQTQEPIQDEQPSQAAQGSDTQPPEQESAQGDSHSGEAKQQPPATIPYERFAESRREMAELKRQHQELLNRLNGTQQPQKPQGAPRPEDYPDYDAFNSANIAYHVQQAIATERQRTAQEQQQKTVQDRIRSADEKWNQAYWLETTKDPSFQVKMETAPSLRDDVQFALKDSENPIGIARFLLDNPAEVLRLNNLPPDKVLREMGKLEVKLTGASGQPSPKVSQMPKPMTPVSGGKSTGAGGEMGLGKALEILYPT